MEIKGVQVYADTSIPQDVLEQEVDNELSAWVERKKCGHMLGSMVFVLDADGEITITASSKEPIRRIRRVTGYNVDISKMNDAKRAEVAKRYVHFKNKSYV